MRGTYFETFLAGGLTLLVIAALAIAFLMWRRDETRRASISQAVRGAGEEFRLNMHQTLRQIADLRNGRIGRSRDLPVMTHPQLDGVLAAMVEADKRALAGLHGVYCDLEGAKGRLRHALDSGNDLETPLQDAERAAVQGICTLYLWEKHGGRAPQDASSTRSGHVRDWLKANGYSQDLVPGMALRDEVVECLRRSGMGLTPKPLTHSAREYYALAGPAVLAARRKRETVAAAPAVAADVTPRDERTAETAPPPAEASYEPLAADPDPEPARSSWQDLAVDSSASGEEVEEPAQAEAHPSANGAYHDGDAGDGDETGGMADEVELEAPAWAGGDEADEDGASHAQDTPSPSRRRMRSRRR